MRRGYATSPHNWTSEQEEFIRDNIEGTPYKEIHKMVNDKFCLSLTFSQVIGFMKRNGISNGRDMTFKKGNKSWNKGMKGLRFKGSERGWFKKGQRPHNKVDVGEEILTQDGYIRVKVQDHGTFTQRFESKQRLIWEKHHGPIPDGHAVIFGDGNRDNFDLDNLILVSRAQLAVMNKQGLIRDDSEITKSGAILADVILKTNKRKRE